MIFDKRALFESHYKRLDVQYCMFNYIKGGKEFAMLTAGYGISCRHIKITNVQGFQFWFRNLSMLYDSKKYYNLYYSMASYSDIPNRNGNLSTSIDKHFWDNHTDYMTGYDFFLDIDCKKKVLFDGALRVLQDIKNLFDKLNVPYEMVFSGKGFHFKVPSEFVDIEKDFRVNNLDSIYRKYYKILKWLHDNVSPLIDHNIADARRLCKIPYSLAVYKNSITMPFQFNSETEYLEFLKNPKRMMTPLFWYDKLYKRQRFLFNRDGKFSNLVNYIDSAERL
jgi:hypothetical protein